MASSERCERALVALKSEAMPYVLNVVIRANQEDNDSHSVAVDKSFADVFVAMPAERVDQPKSRAKSILAAMRDPFADALCVVMYAGRDDFSDEHPYEEFAVDSQFREWWDYLAMEGEHYAREQMGTKWPLGEYLRKGAYMFRVAP